MSRVPSLCLIAVLALIATACGANPTPSDEVADAGARLKAAGTFRLETVSSGWSDEASEFRSTGVVDYANDRSEYRDESTGCREITIGDVYYSEYAPQEGDLPAGKRWLKSRSEDYDTEALYEQSLEQNEQSLEQTSSNGELTVQSYSVSFGFPEPGPNEYLEYLRKTSGEPELVGEEDVRGVSTTRYHSTIDARTSARRMLEAEGWKARNIARYLEDVDGMTAIDVWVDSDGLVRRVVTVESSEDPVDEDMASEYLTTTEYFDFGLEAQIQPPPAAEVAEESPSQLGEVMSESMDALESGDVDESELLPDEGGWESYPPDESNQPPRCLP